MLAPKQLASRFLKDSQYRHIRDCVAVEEKDVSVVQFFDPKEEFRDEICKELFCGTKFKHVDNAWASDGSRAIIYCLDFEAPAFESDLKTVLDRLARK